MFAKLMVLIIAGTATAAALLWLRQQRVELAHEITTAHQQIDATRQATWDLQVKVAAFVEPNSLNQALARAELDLEPLTITPGAEDLNRGPTRVVERTPRRR